MHLGLHLGLQDTLVQPYFQRDLFSEQSPNHSQNKYTRNDHSQLDPVCSSSIPPPGKWSHRTKEGLTFLSNTPSLLLAPDPMSRLLGQVYCMYCPYHDMVGFRIETYSQKKVPRRKPRYPHSCDVCVTHQCSPR